MKNYLLADIPEGAGFGGDSGTKITNPVIGSLQQETGVGFFQAFIPSLIGLLFVGGSIFFVFMMLWGALSWILSGGDKAAIEGARGRITSALVGVILLFSTFALIKIIEAFFGIDILTIDIGPLVIK